LTTLGRVSWEELGTKRRVPVSHRQQKDDLCVKNINFGTFFGGEKLLEIKND